MKLNSPDLFEVIVIVIIILIVVGAPFVGIGRVITTQQALNQECKTNYTLLQVALSGDNLARLCQIKNQTVTVK
jgi:hypothetical protein